MSPLERELAYAQEINDTHYKPRGHDLFRLSPLWVAFINNYGREPSNDEWEAIKAEQQTKAG